MSQTHGTEGTVKIGSDAVGELTAWTIDESGETIQTNQPTIGTPAPALTFIGGATSWTASLTCFWDDNDTAQAALTIGATGTINVYPAGETSGDAHWSGSIIVTGISTSADNDSNAGASFTIQGTGALTKSTVA
jgi:hypothetical protein